MIKSKARISIVAVITPDPDMGAKWVRDLTGNADTINKRRKKRVDTDGTFGQLIATQSADEYGPMVAPGFVSKGDLSAEDIRTKQRDNLMNAYNKYNDNLDRMFEEVDGVEAKRFKESVEAKQSSWEEGIPKVLRLTGSKANGRQAASLVGYWLTGYQHIVGQMPEGTVVLAGGPYDIAKAKLKATLRTGLTQLLVQTGVTVTASGYSATVLASQNQRIKDYLESMADPLKATDWVSTITADKSYCVWFVEEGQLKLEVQIYIP
ncbi:MAG: hypothetical protein WC980_01605 [Candidatus Brocadiia bacterium]